MKLTQYTAGFDGACHYVSTGYRRAYVMFDMCNGGAWGKNDIGKGYMWVFSSRKDAMLHRKTHNAKNHNARLSMPIKISIPR